mmetsp:Transcript_9768/g.17828  ORF Transcript_9768/g.17828 Transcript_9768/m.17828 type:complete len:220 (-) Transcript_9768:390-1049(-)
MAAMATMGPSSYSAYVDTFEVARVPRRQRFGKNSIFGAVALVGLVMCVIAWGGFSGQSVLGFSSAATASTRSFAPMMIKTPGITRNVDVHGVSFGNGINERITPLERRVRRKLHIRKKVEGTPERPRLTIFRSNNHMYGQIIDDSIGHTIASAGTVEKDVKAQVADKTPKEAAEMIGKLLGERAKAKGVEKIVFDRNGYKYHGRVAAVADGAREAGLVF